MSESTENTLTAYLGPEFQFKLMWQLLVEPDYAEKTLPILAIEYFDDPNLKRLFIIILEYYKEFSRVPNLLNKSIHQAVNRFKTPNNIIEEESQYSLIRRFEQYNQRIVNKEMANDGDVVQKMTYNFVKQQEYRKIGEYIINKTKSGGLKDKYVVNDIEERFIKVSNIGEEDDDCEEVIDGIDAALLPEFRNTIPTGIEVIDALTGGGLGKGEIGLILTPSGVGKTTILTKIANTAYEMGYNVAQIIFEDTKPQIKRKHYTIWSNIGLSKLDENYELARERAHKKAGELRGHGRLLLKKFKKEDVTMKDVREWMTGYEKKWNIKIDLLVIDYLDCLESHKKSADRNESELVIVKAFEKLASDFDIPAWSAIQSNRSGFNTEYVSAQQSGGSIKRYQKAHFFMSVAKTAEQKEAQLANISILKARFAQDGQLFQDCVFNNDTMEIRIEDDRYKYNKLNKGKRKYDTEDIDNLDKKTSDMSKFHSAVGSSQYNETSLIDKANSETVNDAMREDILRKLLEEKANNIPQPPLKPNTEFDEPLGVESDEIITKVAIHDTSDNNDAKNEMSKLMATEGATEGAITNDGVNDGLNDGVSEGVSEGISEGITTNDAVNDTVNDTVFHPEADFHEKEIKKSAEIVDIDELENMLIDPDKIENSEKLVHELLIKQRVNQDVIKKEK